MASDLSMRALNHSSSQSATIVISPRFRLRGRSDSLPGMARTESKKEREAREREEERQAYGRRLRQALGLADGEKYGTQRVIEFATLLDTSRQMVTGAFRGKKLFGAKSNSLIAEHLGVDPDWLATGDAEKYQMRSNRVWPFRTIARSTWEQLPEETRAHAEDLLAVTIARAQIAGGSKPVKQERDERTPTPSPAKAQ